MGQLLVSGLDDRIIRALERRAARAGRTVEAEHRALLEEVLGPGSDCQDGTDPLRPLRNRRADPVAVERLVQAIEVARRARTPEEERAIDEFLKEIGAA